MISLTGPHTCLPPPSGSQNLRADILDTVTQRSALSHGQPHVHEISCVCLKQIATAGLVDCGHSLIDGGVERVTGPSPEYPNTPSEQLCAILPQLHMAF